MSSTEILATSAVKTMVALCPNLEPAINECDKYPSYDGDILIMRDGSKENLEIVRARIKGRRVASEKELGRDSVSYSISVKDLQNYHANGGVLFFVVLLWDGKSRIFCRSLLPGNTGPLLELTKGKTTTIKLMPAPAEALDFEEMVLNHSKHSRMQASFAGTHIASVEEIQSMPGVELVSSHTGYLGEFETPVEHLIGRETFIYGQLPSCPIPVPTQGSIILAEASSEIPADIAVADERFFDSLMSVVDAEGSRHVIGSELTISFPRAGRKTGQVDYTFAPKGPLPDVIKSIEMMDRLTEGDSLEIDGEKYDLGLDRMRDMFEEAGLPGILELLKRFQNFQRSIGDVGETVVDKIDDRNVASMDVLYRGVVLREPIKVKHDPNARLLMDVAVFNRRYLVLAVHHDEERRLLYDLASIEMELYATDSETGERQRVTKYALRPKENWLALANVTPNLIQRDCMEAGCSDANRGFANLLGLYLLGQYDTNGNREALDAALGLFEWLNDPGMVAPSCVEYELNWYQAKQRKRTLSMQDRDRLFEIYEADLEKKAEDRAFGMAALVILGDGRAVRCFEKLSKEAQASIADYPIGALMSQVRAGEERKS